MKFTEKLLVALIVYIFITNYSYSQHYRAREDYSFLKLLPKYNNAAGLYTVNRYDFSVTTKTGIKLDALKFIPTGTPPAGGWPTVIYVHGYGDNKETLAGFAKAQAEYGYYTAAYSVRGQGQSGGLSNLISTLEAQDLMDFVDYIKADSVNGSAPSNILIMGGSQGGLLPYMASCMGLKVKTIISALAPPNFASSWIENGSIKMTLLWSVEYTPDTVRYDPQVDRMSDWIYANNKQYWDSLAYWLPIGRDFMNIIPNNKVPLIMEGSWQDKFFNPTGIIQAADLNTNSFFRLYLGAVQGHGGDHSDTEDQWHMNFFNDWFFYWMFNIDNGMLNKPKYEYASTTYPVTDNNYWTFVHDSSFVPFRQVTSDYRLYFNTNNRLTTGPNTVPKIQAVLRNQVSNGLTMQQAVYDEFTGRQFNRKFKKRNLTFTSGTLKSDLKWLGTPKIGLDFESTANTFVQFNFQIYEVQPNGTQRLVNRVNYTDRDYVKNSARNVLINGHAHSHIFKAGNKIRIKVTNLDTSPEDVPFFGTNPFVLPVLNNGYNYINLNSNSYIDIPVYGPPPFPVADRKENNEPVRFSLSQNYPNPFNPSTKISFTVPSPDAVTVLKVFDITGREVKTIINQNLEAGTYNIIFEGIGLSSGVYFYTLKSGNFTETRKMLLIK